MLQFWIDNSTNRRAYTSRRPQDPGTWAAYSPVHFFPSWSNWPDPASRTWELQHGEMLEFVEIRECIIREQTAR